MSNSPRKLNHPSFGSCELVPSLVVIRWTAPTKAAAAKAALSRLTLKLADETSNLKRTNRFGQRHDPTAATVNHSENLTWASGAKLSEAAWVRISADPKVQWIAPVYKAKGAEGGIRSYFAINPTVLVLTSQAADAIGDLSALDSSAMVDEPRTALMKGFVVLKLPRANAIELAEVFRKALALNEITGGLKFENIPYVSPTTACGCGCGNKSKTGHQRLGKCAPSQAAYHPNDSFFPQQWGLQRINAPSVWPITKGDPNIVVAVLDQGVELGHPDLNLWPISYSTVTHTNDGSPVGNHGTTCAGIIGGRMDNGLGVVGLASDCRVMAIATNFADTEVAEGLYYAADNGARVVSMSFGVYPSWMVWDFAIIEAALQYCQDKNVVLVAASGNENQPVSRFPGSDPRTFCVGGSNRDDVRKRIGDASVESWWGASYGPDVDVIAPCLEIPTTDRLGSAGYTSSDYDMFFNGTSSATPHVAALAGLVISVNPSLSNSEVREIISETTDKINAASYIYLATPGKPFGTWNAEVGYGRINAERAVLLACSYGSLCKDRGVCGVDLPEPDGCCVSPCDPPWLPDQECLVRYEEKFFRVPIGRDGNIPNAVAFSSSIIEFRITYEHRMCLLGKQHGPLLFTTTLLPGETVKLYHSDRYRRITSTEQRYSVQTTFMQFLSLIHQARVSGSLDLLNEQLSSSKSGSAGSAGGGFFFGLFGGGGAASSSSSTAVASHTMLSAHSASEQFIQSVQQASQFTRAERSVVVSSYEERETQDITVRTIHNANECRAITYFVRQIVELYALSTRISDISYRIIAPGLPPEWHTIDDLGWVPPAIRNQIEQALRRLPRIGQVVSRPRPFSIPTDGVVYDPELAHCCTCEPERAAAIHTRLEREKAEAMKACLEVQGLELELQRRKMLLQRGELGRFELTAALVEPQPSLSVRQKLAEASSEAV